MPEYIYILTNPSMPDLIKVGKTKKHPLKRMKELNSTGVPKPFKLQLSLLVDDCSLTERQAHRILARYRLNRRREFFKISVKKAIEMLLTNLSNYKIDDIYQSHGIKELCEEITRRNEKILQENLRLKKEYEYQKLKKISQIKRDIYLERQKLEVISRLHQRPNKKETPVIATLFMGCFFPFPFGWLVWVGGLNIFESKNFHLGLFFIFLLIIGYFCYKNEIKNKKEFDNKNSHFNEIDERLCSLERELKKLSSTD